MIFLHVSLKELGKPNVYMLLVCVCAHARVHVYTQTNRTTTKFLQLFKHLNLII